MLTRFSRTLVFGLLAAALIASPARSQGNSNGHGKGHNNQNDNDSDEGKGKGNKGNHGNHGNRGNHGRHNFEPHDREIISGYFSQQGSNLPPGLAKRNGNLPPGLERQLQRNGTLPPGLQKRFQPFPEELERQLPPLEPEYRRGVIGTQVVIFNRHTNIIVDLFAY